MRYDSDPLFKKSLFRLSFALQITNLIVPVIYMYGNNHTQTRTSPSQLSGQSDETWTDAPSPWWADRYHSRTDPSPTHPGEVCACLHVWGGVCVCVCVHLAARHTGSLKPPIEKEGGRKWRRVRGWRSTEESRAGERWMILKRWWRGDKSSDEAGSEVEMGMAMTTELRQGVRERGRNMKVRWKGSCAVGKRE